MTRLRPRTAGEPAATLVPAAAIAAGMIALLALLGRRWWCSCGSLSPLSLDAWSAHNSQHLVDPYTPSHFLHGIVFYALASLALRRVSPRGRFLAAMVLEAAWEVLENTPFVIERYRAVTMALDYYGDSILNSAGDLLAFVPGYLLASRLRPRWSVAVFLLTELTTTIWIRDGLLLNVLMLLWPVDAIRAWQMSGLAP